MNDSFVTAINTQRVTKDWIDGIAINLSNIYTPGFRQINGTFSSFLNGSTYDEIRVKTYQGKSMPGTSPENVYLEGQGFFVTKRPDGKILYTRLGEFTFDGEGLYKTKEGYAVQGYILNDKGEVQAGVSDPNVGREADDLAQIPTTDIKLWIDPSNGKYLGKYEEFEIKGDGVLYGKADKGKIKVPLYKISVMNFHNPAEMTQVKEGYYIENDASGKPVVGRGEIRGGLLEMSNTFLGEQVSYFQQAKVQLDMANKLVSTNKQLLEEALKLLQ
jgi:flagellar basal body rod protein FlgG